MSGFKQSIKLAERHYRQADFDKAKFYYQQSLDENHRTAIVLERLGHIALLENKPEQAIAYLKQAIDKQNSWMSFWPLNAGLTYRLASAYYRKDDFALASRFFNKAAGPFSIGPFAELKALARHLALFENNPPYQISGPDVSVIQFIKTDPLPLIEVSLNGQGPYVFFIDTGAAEVIIDASLAATLGVDVVTQMRGEFAGGRKAGVGLGRADDIQLGDMQIAELPVHVMDLEPVAEIFQQPVQGVIGTRLLMHFYSTLDYSDGQLLLRRLGDGNQNLITELSCTSRVFPFWLAESHMMLTRGSFNELPSMMLLLDTGLAGRGFMPAVSLLKKANIHVDWSKAIEGVGGGGKVNGVDVLLDSVTLGSANNSLTKHQVQAVVNKKNPSILGNKLGFLVGGLISHEFFRDMCLTLDFEQMRLIVEVH